MPKLNGARSKRSRSRKRQFGETKPNFRSEIKKEWEDFLKTEGPRIKEKDPEFYYHLVGRKLPKKYQNGFGETKPISPTPPEVIPVKVKEKTAKEKELEKEKFDKFHKKQLMDMKEKQRKEYNRVTFEKQQKLVRWCDAHRQDNWRNIHSEEYKRKTEKKYEYY
jgi:hypothetical protein